MITLGIALGFILYIIVRIIIKGFYVVEQNERAVKTTFGKAERLTGLSTLDIPDFSESLSEDEKDRYISST